MTIQKPTEEEKQAIETRFVNAQSELLKPFDEKLTDIINSLGLPKEKREQLHKMVVSTNLHWEDLSDEELRTKLNLMSQVL